MRKILQLCLVLAVLLAMPAVAQENDVKGVDPVGPGSGIPEVVVGPDTFGYIGRDETEPDGPVYNFIDISVSGTATGLTGDDAGTAPLAIGFPFNFYGTDYTEVAASTNGYMNFNTGGDLTDFGNDCPGLNAFDPDQSIYALWDDLIMDSGTSDFYTENFAACPNTSGGFDACTVFMWQGVRHLGGTATWDMQTILYDNNNILIQVGAGNDETGSGSTTGIENQTPSNDGLDYACNTAGSIPDNRAVLFCYPGNTCPPAAAPTTALDIPTVSHLGLIGLALLLGLAGVAVMYRRLN